jgi:hypothetical protein
MLACCHAAIYGGTTIRFLQRAALQVLKQTNTVVQDSQCLRGKVVWLIIWSLASDPSQSIGEFCSTYSGVVMLRTTKV